MLQVHCATGRPGDWDCQEQGADCHHAGVQVTAGAGGEGGVRERRNIMGRCN